MPKNLQGLTVFVASPGGLEPERTAFFDTLNRFNVDDGHELGVAFIPQGHELAYAGAGRPQELINQQIRESDYLLVVFWDKWGFQPDTEGKYTSGTEEEFYIGLECLADVDHPMADVVVFFKGTPDRQLSDPGTQLQKVLDFRKKLEVERRVLYRNFDDLAEFSMHLRRLLSKWSRDRRNGGSPKATLPPPAGSEYQPLFDGPADGESLVDRARRAAKAGQSTLAHQLFTQATTGTYDRVAWTEYVRFLRRTNRIGVLQSVGDKMIEKARDLNDHQGAAEGLSNLGIAKRSQGHRTVALKYFDRALKEIDAWDEKEGEATPESISMRAFLLDNRGLTLRRMRGRLPDAVRAIDEAISLHAAVGDDRGRAHAFRNSAIVLTQAGSYAQAIDALRTARGLFEALDDERGLAMTLSSLGEALEFSGIPQQAIKMYELALHLNTNLNNLQGKSMNLAHLSRAQLATGNQQAAAENAEACIALNVRSGNTEGMAAALHAQGRVELAAGNRPRAQSALREALTLFQEVDQPAGTAGVSLDLATIALDDADLSAATDLLLLAKQTLDESPHAAISQTLQIVQDRLQSAGPGQDQR